MNVPLLRQPRDSQTRAHMHLRDAPGPHGSMGALEVRAWTGNAVRRELIRGNVVHFAILMNTLFPAVYQLPSCSFCISCSITQ